ncbi:hypothetical protein E1B28_002885 [Marasmius oreades]|uniref:DUF6533 domain-containing protein n=1 Tax=Marasmius oreades TaxID=181124 RepID=A0A9P7RNK7_9AGAR|nr:uncharacterized protein E1B28_002885 [Marasmius oreades]KAG7086969.1 hypothetical protein E1B28_002885 [Marasmius oreades]
MVGTFLSFEHVLQAIQVTRYSELASSTVIIFDHLITLDDEIELIWVSSILLRAEEHMKNLHDGKREVLGLLEKCYFYSTVTIRLHPSLSTITVCVPVPSIRLDKMVGYNDTYVLLALFASSHTNSVSLQFFKWQGWTGLLACMIAETILQMRLYALYSLNQKVLIAMVATFILTSATAAAIMGVVLSNLTAISLQLQGVVVCLPLTVSSSFYAFWIPILAFETVLCCLALFRGYQTFRTSGSPFQSGRKLVGMLIRDSIAYFLVMFGIYLTNLLVFAIDLTLIEVPIGWSIALSCVLGNRVILNVRREIAHPEDNQLHPHGHLPNPNEPPSPLGSHESKSTPSSSRCSKGGRWSLKGKERLEVAVEYESETLTDLEMAQLRSMREDDPDPDENFH